MFFCTCQWLLLAFTIFLKRQHKIWNPSSTSMASALTKRWSILNGSNGAITGIPNLVQGSRTKCLAPVQQLFSSRGSAGRKYLSAHFLAPLGNPVIRTKQRSGGEAFLSAVTGPPRFDDSAVRRRSILQKEWSSCPKFTALAEQLRNYRAPPPRLVDDEDHGVTSSIGMPASEASRNDLKVFPTKGKAAVLVCLYKGSEGEVRVILTKRAGSLSSHSGEVSLPGGKREKGDSDDTATALREAYEEIGLIPAHVRVVTSLEPFLSKNLLTVIPVVGFLDDKRRFEPVPNPDEVHAIFDAPLEMFLKDENYWFQEREWLGVKYRVHFFDYTAANGENFLVWGLTASILIRAASVNYQRKPDFLEFTPDFEQMVTSARAGIGCNPVTKPALD